MREPFGFPDKGSINAGPSYRNLRSLRRLGRSIGPAPRASIDADSTCYRRQKPAVWPCLTADLAPAPRIFAAFGSVGEGNPAGTQTSIDASSTATDATGGATQVCLSADPASASTRASTDARSWRAERPTRPTPQTDVPVAGTISIMSAVRR